MCIDRQAVDRECIIDWIAKFLNYWEDESMLYRPAAEIIVDQLLNFKITQKTMNIR